MIKKNEFFDLISKYEEFELIRCEQLKDLQQKLFSSIENAT